MWPDRTETLDVSSFPTPVAMECYSSLTRSQDERARPDVDNAILVTIDQVRNIDMPMLVRLRRLFKAGPFLRGLPVPLP